MSRWPAYLAILVLLTVVVALVFEAKRAAELERLAKVAEQAKSLGLGVNAGHGLNYENTRGIFAVPHLNELNIGHSIVSRAVTVGLGQAVREILELMDGYPQAE